MKNHQQQWMTYDHLADVFARTYAEHGSIPEALRALDGYRLERAAANVNVDSYEVVRMAAQAFGISPKRVLDGDRHRAACNARWVAAKVLHVRGWSSPRIGHVLGLDHSSVLHALKVLQDRPDLMEATEALLEALSGGRSASSSSEPPLERAA
jgi:chromosomal replication initiation ATPase DnaA